MTRNGVRAVVLGLAAVCAMPVAMRAQNDLSSDDKSFIKDSQEGSLAEINFAKLALTKSKDPNVRKFAERMIQDHQKLIDDMKPLAMKYHVKEPTGAPVMDHAKYEELKMKNGTDFDRAYVEAMVKDHTDDLKEFLKEENSTQNPQLKQTVEKGAKVVREHLEMIDNIAHMGGIQTPPMPS